MATHNGSRITNSPQENWDLSVTYRSSVQVLRRSVRHILRASTVRMSDDSDDVIQTVFLKLLELDRSGKTATVRRPQHYAFAVARRCTLDLLHSRRRTVFLATIREDSKTDAVQNDLYEVPVAKLAIYSANLAPELAAVFRMRFEKGYSQVRASEELGITRQKLRTLERRIKDGAVRAVRSGFTE